jgi:hypothetical protein
MKKFSQTFFFTLQAEAGVLLAYQQQQQQVITDLILINNQVC